PSCWSPRHGVEPATGAVQGRCSSQLSYEGERKRNGAPSPIRTDDLRVTSALLWPAELSGPRNTVNREHCLADTAGEAARTCAACSPHRHLRCVACRQNASRLSSNLKR